jgi:AraC-like DNA-binding protein
MIKLPSDTRLLDALESVTGAPKREVLVLFDYLDELQFWIKDRLGRFLWVNRYFLLNYGLKERSEVIGKTDFDLSEASLANRFRLDDEKVLGGSTILSRIEMVGRFDHQTVWCVTTKLPLRDAKKRIIGTTGFNRPYREKNLDKTDAPLAGALEYINKNLTGRITNADLAKAAGLSLRVFHRRFQALYHSPPHEYIRQLRVRMSCSALVYTKKSLAVIADEFGFSDQSHFTSEFHRIMGDTPGVYRARHQT